ncbi:hypothetical protein AGMMS50256_27040 [Betaproteobacteria bacterium]|nr:hypothetical protein AGMMS50256_27040 [Betaproteobacteria bacterium]
MSALQSLQSLQWGSVLDQHFDTAALAAAARAQSAFPLRRAGRLTEMMVVGVAACLANQPACPTLVLAGSCIGARVISHQVITEIIIAREAPFPYDFLATQPILAAVPLRQNFPCLTNVLYQPWSDDVELHWQQMRTLARVWLQAGRCERVICGQVETAGRTGEDEHHGRWQTLERIVGG